jgi:excisionase family DNA binding protein
VIELTVTLTDEQLAQIAERVAVLLVDQAPTDDGYLSSDQAAQFLGCPRSRVHDLVQLRMLTPRRDGRALRFRKCDLRAYLEASA